MSEEQLKAFFARVSADPELQSQMNDVTDPVAFISLAKQAGFDLEIEDLLKHPYAPTRPTDLELGDVELERIAGGTAVAIDCILTIPTWCVWKGDC